MDADELQALEIELSTARADETLPPGQLDENHYRSIHHHLFQDLYDWAGQDREVRTSKGDSHFCYPEHIEAQLGLLFQNLKANNYFKGLTAEQFAQEAAAFLSTLNVIHAFREGNGRAQLTFLLVLAQCAGHDIDLTQVTPEELLRAMIDSFHGDERPLADCLLRCAASGSA